MTNTILQNFTYDGCQYKKGNKEDAVKSKTLPTEIIDFLKAKGRLKVSLF